MSRSLAPLVDTHFHVRTLDMPVAGDAWHQPTHDATIEQLLHNFDEHGVQFGVISASSIHGEYNDYTREALRRHPGRFRATAIVHPRTDIYILERMHEDGFRGVRFQWLNMPEQPDLGSADHRLLLRRLRDLGWHVQLNEASTRLAPALEHLEAAGVRVVVDHFGRPNPALGVNCPGFQRLLRSIDKGNTWVKLAAGYRMEPADKVGDYAQALLKVAGGERLLWGSDWPFSGCEDRVSYADTVANLEEWVPDERVRRQIGTETPLKLFFA
jgi:predicted TIM-barrel fold metal-dependent hydrolase